MLGKAQDDYRSQIPAFRREPYSTGEDIEQLIETVVRLISDDLRREITLEELSRHVNLSPSRLGHLFKAETGMSPSQYLKSMRMQKAKELLETTFLSVKQIMLNVGTGDKSRFAHDFRMRYGATPAQYRAHVLARRVTTASVTEK